MLANRELDDVSTRPSNSQTLDNGSTQCQPHRSLPASQRDRDPMYNSEGALGTRAPDNFREQGPGASAPFACDELLASGHVQFPACARSVTSAD